MTLNPVRDKWPRLGMWVFLQNFSGSSLTPRRSPCFYYSNGTKQKLGFPDLLSGFPNVISFN